MPAVQGEEGKGRGRPARGRRTRARSPWCCLSPPGNLLLVPQRMVVEQAARGSSPPDLCLQHLHQIQASHEVRPLGGLVPKPPSSPDSGDCLWPGSCVALRTWGGVGSVTSVCGPPPCCWLGPSCPLGGGLPFSQATLSRPEGTSGARQGGLPFQGTDEPVFWPHPVSGRVGTQQVSPGGTWCPAGGWWGLALAPRCPLQALLREVRTLRDQLCVEDEAGSRTAAERLLQVYRQLRSPGLLLL